MLLILYTKRKATISLGTTNSLGRCYMRKIKILMMILCAAFMAFGMVSSASALTIYITPDTQTQYAAYDLSMLDTLYKAEVGKAEDPPTTEEGTYSGSYETFFYNEPLDPSDAKIVYTGGPYIAGSPLILHVKDGVSHEPPEYFFNLLNLVVDIDSDDNGTLDVFDASYSWNGTDTIYLVGFWYDPSGSDYDKGAISNVGIYGVAVPEPTTLILLGFGLLGLAGIRRK